jgi:diguanylate cyclase (GGDEF)-like protein
MDETRHLQWIRSTAPGRALMRWSPLAVMPLLGLMMANQQPRVSTLSSVVTGILLNLFNLLGIVACVRRLGRRSEPALRPMLAWMLVALVDQLVVGIGYAVSSGKSSSGAVLAALLALRLPLTLALMIALIVMPGRRRSRQALVILGFDLVMIAGAAMLALWYFILGPAIVTGMQASLAGMLASIVAASDGMVACGAAFVIMRGVVPSVYGLARLLIGAVVLLMVPDVSIAYGAVHHSAFEAGQHSFWLAGAGAYLLLLAARSTCAVGVVEDGGPDTHRGMSTWMVEESALPYLGVLLGFGLIVWAAFHSPLFPWGGLALGTIVMAGAVVMRQLYALHENRRLAETDHVTGITNRTGLSRALESALTGARENGEHAPRVAVLLLDLDGFKKINDTHGHQTGDEVLATFAGVLRRSVLGRDIVARLGGDEFVVVLTRIERVSDAITVAERILEDLRVPHVIAGVEITLRTSIGVAVADQPTNAAAILYRADQAMYEAKRQSGSRWSVYGDEYFGQPIPAPPRNVTH